MLTRVLFVDDDPHALAGFQRTLHGRFEVEVAHGGTQGLQTVAAGPPFAVVVADMRMPSMNGVQFLARVREIAPDTIRMMLTGNADLDCAIGAVNDGSIFRFLRKPCSSTELAATLAEGWAQFEMVRAERELLEETLRGCVKVLTEVLALVNPGAFGRAMRMAEIVRQLAAKTPWLDRWKFEVAALLSQLGAVTLAPEQLSGPGDARTDAHWIVARDLIDQIPRLHDVAQMVARQRESHVAAGAYGQSTRDAVTAGARMLRLAGDLDAALSEGRDYDETIAQLHAADGLYDPALLCHLHELERPACAGGATLHVRIDALETGMIVQEDVRTSMGLLLVGRGQAITILLRQRLQNFGRVHASEQTVCVKRRASPDAPAHGRVTP
jgi:CheY-like chemotaxis protein